MTRTTFFFSAVSAVVGLAVGLSTRPKCYERHHGYDLMPVVVAAVDVPAGTPLTFEMISQRSVPERFVSRNMVRPDSATNVVGVAPTRPLEAGEILGWSDFPDGVTRLLPQSARAVAIDLDRDVHVGDQLDLLLSDGTPLLENVRALTAGRSPWLQLTVDQAVTVARSGTKRPLTVVLRGMTSGN